MWNTEQHFVPYAADRIEYNMTKMSELTFQEKALLAYIEAAKEAELMHSYDISYMQRINAGYSWLYARKKNQPFNTFLQFHFEFDPADCHDNAEKIRSVHHHLLSYLHRNGKISSNVIWVRSNPVNTNIETCMLLAFVPDNLYEDFRKYAVKWDGHNIDVCKVTYDREWETDDGKTVTVFELMFAATDSKTRSRIPNVHTLDSGILFRPRTFCSQKLSRKQIELDMKTAIATSQVEALQARLDANKGVA